ncbi:MAG: TonB-dependent receptor [Ferruginibacter sp.]|nr:TonB-dependent receptor [Cytophagales bacterium]
MERTIPAVLFLCFCLSHAHAQSIRGRITDAQTGKPLGNVNLALVHAPGVTVSDRMGNFTLAFPPGNSSRARVLRISSVGYETLDQTVAAGDGEVVALDVSLQPAVIQLNKAVVVTAQRYQTRQFDSPEAISVLGPAELRQNAPRSTPEALVGTAGVWMQKTNHGGGSPFIRGLTGQQTLLMIDGIRLNNATFRSGPNQYLNTIDPQTIEQIEVVRGSGSVQYGSDALGGVAQVITRDPPFSSDGFRVKGGAYAKYLSADMEKSGRAEIGLSSEKVAVLGGFAYRDFGDIKAGGNLGFLRPTGYAQRSGDLKARFRVAKQHQLTVAYQMLDQDRVPLFHRVQLENYAYSQFEPQQRQLGYARWEWFSGKKWLRSVQVTGSLQRWKEGRQSQRNGSPVRTEERDDVDTRGATLVVNSEPTPSWTINSGVEYYHDRVGSARRDVNEATNAVTDGRGLYPDGATSSNLALYSLHTVRLDKLTLAAGGRFNAFRITVTENTLGESRINPSALVGNASAVYAFHPSHHLVASVNTAFRAPNVDDLGTLGIVDFRYEVPNGNLKPEKSTNVELGWKARTGRFAGSLAVYRNYLTDIITRVRQGRDSVGAYPVYLKENTAKAYIQGVEADAEWQLTRHLAAFGNLIYTYGQNQTAEEPFRRIPPLNSRLGLRYQRSSGPWAKLEWLSATKQARLAKGDQDDNRISKGGTPGWNVVNLQAGYRASGWMLGIELQNLFDEAYRAHGSGVDGYGRSAWVSGRIWF